jgi:hypothetical protein
MLQAWGETTGKVPEQSSPIKAMVSSVAEGIQCIQVHSESKCWFQHIHQVDGTIIKLLDGPLSPPGDDEAPVASLGTIVDSYLDSHG